MRSILAGLALADLDDEVVRVLWVSS